jgi:hypothetical protein
MKETDWRINAIINRRNLDLEFNASIHGMKLKTQKVGKLEPITISKEQEIAIEKAMESAKLRKLNGR